jgi:hypothetical protein
VVDDHFGPTATFESARRRPLSPQLPTKCNPSKIQILKSEETPNRYFIVQTRKSGSTNWVVACGPTGLRIFPMRMCRSEPADQ